MSEELDYRSMRILPVSLLLLLLIIPLLNISMLTVMITLSESGIKGVAASGGLDTVYYACEFFNLAFSIVSLVCLYRMNGISRSYNYAWIILVFEMLSELIRQIVGLFVRIYGKGLFSHILYSALNIIPKLLVVAGVAVLLNGLIEMIDEIDGAAGISGRPVPYAPAVSAAHIRTLNKTWIILEIVRNLMWFLLYAGMYIMMYAVTISPGIISVMIRISIVISIILTFIHIAISIIIFLNTWKVFGNYYLYRYNRGV
ncbi:MAG: hypothetical protein IJ661_06355 [Lachnospiraceae bacterium]|nr:hypothetical protein [Lachnospiraceae bacterium]